MEALKSEHLKALQSLKHEHSEAVLELKDELNTSEQSYKSEIHVAYAENDQLRLALNAELLKSQEVSHPRVPNPNPKSQGVSRPGVLTN